MHQMLREVLASLRFLLRHPSFSLVILATIAVAIAINVTVFTGVNAVLLRPLPFHDAEQLVSLAATRAHDGSTGPMSAAEIRAYETESGAFESLAAYFRQPEDRFDPDAFTRFISVPVSNNFFDVIGVRPALGRTFLPEDSSESYVVVLSHGFWQRRFAGRPDVLEQQIRFGGASYRIVGVMPPGFYHVDGQPADLWTPIWPMSRPTDRRDTAVGRLRAGVSLADAQARVDAVAAELERRYPKSNAGWRTRVVPLNPSLDPELRTALLVMLAGVGFILLIACANVGTMLAARNLARDQEFRIRLALGASRPQLIRETAIESGMLAAAGGVAGIALTFAAIRGLVLLAPPTLPRLTLATVDDRVWMWTAAVTLLVGVLSSVAPAIAASRLRIYDATRGARAETSDRRARRLRAALVVAEVSLATVLVVGAGLMVQTVANLRQADLGFQPARLLSVYLRPGWAAARGGPDMAVYYQALRERVAAVPGVVSVGAAKGLPLVSDIEGFDAPVTSETTVGEGRAPVTARRWLVVPGYFETIGVPLVSGRFFEPADDIQARRTVIVSSSLARRLFGTQDPLGRRVSVPPDTSLHTVVGVVGDIKTLPGDPPVDTIYLARSNTSARLSINLVVATRDDHPSLVPRIRDAILGVEPNVSIIDINRLQDALEHTIGYPRFLARLLNLFGAAGLLLAAIGVHGLGAFGVAQRRREIGVRIAMGAGRRSILALIVGGSVWIAAIGTALGIAIALGLTKYLSSVLYDVSPADPLTFAVTAIVLLASAAIASHGPARRACSVDPAELMRAE